MNLSSFSTMYMVDLTFPLIHFSHLTWCAQEVGPWISHSVWDTEYDNEEAYCDGK